MPERKSEDNDLRTQIEKNAEKGDAELARQITQERRPKVKMRAPANVTRVMGKDVPKNRVIECADNHAKMLANRGFRVLSADEAKELEGEVGGKRGRGRK